MQRIVIIGAGFGGLWAARRLAGMRMRTGPGLWGGKKPLDITLIDRNNYHTFLPLLYQVAAAELEPTQIAYPIRGVFRKRPTVKTVLAEVTGVDTAARIVKTDGLEYPYDYLILSPGSQTAFYGVPGAEKHAFTLKTLEDAVFLRNRLLSCFEMAALMSPEERPEGMLRTIVVGAGPTGVEYAGALAELLRAPVAKDFPELADPKLTAKKGRKDATPEVLLVDGSPLPLPGLPDELREYTMKRLEKMGVSLCFGSAVASVDAGGITLQNGESIRAGTVVWNAGIRGHHLGADMGLPIGRGGRVEVQPTLQVVSHPEIQVIGDIALPDGYAPPPVAPAAIQQGEHAARNIERMIKGDAAESFTYRDKGTMVTIGRSAAVAKIGDYSFTGLPAWVLWLVVHLAFLIGFRNRIFVMITWAWDYFFSDKAVRVILPRDKGMSCCPPGAAPVCRDEDIEN